jgi:hypothetical protein
VQQSRIALEELVAVDFGHHPALTIGDKIQSQSQPIIRPAEHAVRMVDKTPFGKSYGGTLPG